MTPIPVKGDEEIQKLRLLAAQVGCGYLLLCGGEIQVGSDESPALHLMEFTVVGAMAFPSKATQARASLSAALLEVKSGRLLAIFDGYGQDTRRASSLLGTRKREDRAFVEARDKAMVDLCRRVNERLGKGLDATAGGR